MKYLTAIYNSISPFFNPKITVQTIQQKQVIVIEVFATGKKPYFLKSKGIPEGVYIRIGTHSMPATPELIEEFQRSNTQESQDMLTNTGILFFHPEPSKHIVGAEVLFTKFNGTNMDNILRTKDYSSPMLQLIEEVLADLKKRTYQ